MAGVIPSAEAWRRVSAVVKRVENVPPPHLAGDSTATYSASESFFAMILGMNMGGFYSFNRVGLDPRGIDPDAFIVAPTQALRWVFQGDAHVDAAREANLNMGVPIFTIVRMYLAGYDANNEPVFVFVMPPLPPDGTRLPVHDHRSNEHGGLAFSVHHPGTQLPQMPYPF
ncbi:MAG TPA: hypothetical protein VGR35_09585 [Tepidisphaeraceae bacterium]|nr:hypothetical protein [Tepidisphaeraceae bacterium]